MVHPSVSYLLPCLPPASLLKLQASASYWSILPRGSQRRSHGLNLILSLSCLETSKAPQHLKTKPKLSA